MLTGVTPFTGDTALAVAYQRMDNDVAAPSTVIAGVPAQFDELVLRATARDPADRYADARDMGDDLDAIVDELGLPDFRVPAPAQFGSARFGGALPQRGAHQQQASPVLAPRQHTRELPRDDWQPARAG